MGFFFSIFFIDIAEKIIFIGSYILREKTALPLPTNQNGYKVVQQLKKTASFAVPLVKIYRL